MLWDSSTLSEFHTSLSIVLTLIKLPIIPRTYNLIELWLDSLVMLQNGKKTKKYFRERIASRHFIQLFIYLQTEKKSLWPNAKGLTMLASTLPFS